jgi:hypothetical protein
MTSATTTMLSSWPLQSPAPGQAAHRGERRRGLARQRPGPVQGVLGLAGGSGRRGRVLVLTGRCPATVARRDRLRAHRAGSRERSRRTDGRSDALADETPVVVGPRSLPCIRVAPTGHQGREPAHRAGQCVGTAFATSPTTALAATTMRRHVADSPDRETARPLTTFGGVESVNDRRSTGVAVVTAGSLLPGPARTPSARAPVSPRSRAGSGAPPGRRGEAGARRGWPPSRSGWARPAPAAAAGLP